MDYEVYSKIKKGKINALRSLQETELPFAWFVCYSITGEASSAAELLRVSWRNTIGRLLKLGDLGNEELSELLGISLQEAKEYLLYSERKR